MTELPYMPVVVNDEIAETAELSNEELGALQRIKWALWKAGGYLDDDGKKLARVARAGSRWGKIAPAVLEHLTIAAGKISSPSVLETLLITRERRAAKVKAVNARFAKPDPALTSSKPLNSHDVGGRSASLVHMQLKSKLKNTAEELIRSSAAADCTNAAGLARTASTENPGASEDCRKSLLKVHGTELLTTRGGLRTLQAHAQISTWLTLLDADTIAGVLADAERENLWGKAFVNVVGQRLDALVAERTFGPSLPLGPVLRRGENG